MLHTFIKFSFLLFLTISSIAKAQLWTGGVSSDWNNPSNWSSNAVPTINGWVIIGQTPSTYWPALANDVSIKNLSIETGGQLDTKGFTIATNSLSLFRAILINTKPGTDIRFDLGLSNNGSGISGTSFYGNTVITSRSYLREGFSAPNHFAGNVKFIVSESEDLSLAGEKSLFEGNVEIERTVPGRTFIFSNGATVKGNVKYVNNVGGSTSVGCAFDPKFTTTIGGRLDITDLKPTSNPGGGFYIRHVTALNGGEINVQYPLTFEAWGNKLKLTNFSVTGIRGKNVNKYFLENSVEANLTLAMDYWDYYSDLYLSNNVITGTTVFDRKYDEGNIFEGALTRPLYWRGSLGPSQYNGNVSYIGGYTYLGYVDNSKYSESLTLNTNYSTGGGKIIFNGSTDSRLTTNTGHSFRNLEIQKTNGAKLLMGYYGLLITHSLNLVSGYIDRWGELNGPFGSVAFADGATCTGQSDQSHIVGIIVSKVGDDAFTFPVGSGTKLFPLSISGAPGQQGGFSVEYVNADPSTKGYNISSKASSLAKVSSDGYWNIQSNGVATVTPSFGYNLPTGYITDQSKLRVAHWNGSIWEDLGNGGTSGSLTVGTVSTASGVTSFSPFTIASTDASNPLPVKLVKFSVQKENETALLQWSTTEEINSDRFEIENSLDAINWQKIGETKANGESTVLSHYQFVDKTPFSGLNYYRLKMIDADGTFAYSRIESIKLSAVVQTVMYPNPVSDRLFFETTKGVSILKVNLTNSNGIHVLVANNADLNEGIDLSKFPAGIYFVNITLSDSRVETHKVFVK
ncbi:T9SS type A sorting domain-containing protein [Dyadobacter diqingensis]|uniref:T9SS type A sorting domain-containing protein n=1 Tax=Dyadobacter diqingensis TaxID=2938121 RepID=UPI0020C19F55|nr:T9SS type A sorting domain-containing protein [Dyadobacter diqingensis]